MIKSKQELIKETLDNLSIYKDMLGSIEPDIKETDKKEYKNVLSSIIHLKKCLTRSTSLNYITKDTILKKSSEIHNSLVVILAKHKAEFDLPHNLSKFKSFTAKVLEDKYNAGFTEFSGESFNELRKNILSAYNPSEIDSIYINMNRLSKKYKTIDSIFNNVDCFFVKSASELNLFSTEDNNYAVIKDYVNVHKKAQIDFLFKEKKIRELSISKLNEEVSKIARNKDKASIEKANKIQESFYSIYWKKRNISTAISNIIDNNSYTQIEVLMENQAIQQYEKIKQSIHKEAGVVYKIYNIKTSPKGDLNFFADCENGKVEVKTIHAGGHNIQIFHYRTVVHLKSL